MNTDLIQSKKEKKMYKSLSLVLLLSILPTNVIAISFMDSDIKCRCSFQIDLNQPGNQVWVDNIIEDDSITDYCDSQGEEDCIAYCKNQVKFVHSKFFHR